MPGTVSSWHMLPLLVLVLGLGSAFAADDRGIRFTEWLRGLDPLNEAVEVRRVPGSGRGLFVTRDVPAGATLLAVPIEHTVSAKGAISRMDKLVGQDLTRSSLTEGDILAVFLMVQRALGPKSPIAAWIGVLDQHVPSPATWTEGELAELEEPATAGYFSDKAIEWDNRYTYLRGVVFKRHPEVFPPTEWERGHFSRSAYQWARYIVESHAWPVSGALRLVPGACMLNHENHPNATAKSFRAPGVSENANVTERAFGLRYNRKSGIVKLLADRAFAAGQQAVAHYALQPSLWYLERHGFVPPQNPFECMTVFELPFDGADKQREHRVNSNAAHERRTLLRRVGLENPFPPYGVHYDYSLGCLRANRVPDWLLAYFAVPNLEIVEGLLDCRDADTLGELLGCADDATLALAYDDIARWAKRKLRQYSTTYDADVTALQQAVDGVTPRRAATQYRLLKKRILTKLHEVARNRQAQHAERAAANPDGDEL